MLKQILWKWLLRVSSTARRSTLLKKCFARTARTIDAILLKGKFEKKIDASLAVFSNNLDTAEKNRMKRVLWEEMISYLIIPDEYFLYGFEKLDDKQKHQYVGNFEKQLICNLLNQQKDNQGASAIFGNKWKTYERFHEFYHRDAIQITKPEEKEKFLVFCKQHGEAIAKLPDSCRGQGIFFISKNDDLEKKFAEFEDTVLNKGNTLVLEEVVKQAALMSKFNESSVNTVRVATFFNGKELEILFAFLRTGRRGSVVDNGGSGGLMIGIDINTGICITDGFDEAGNHFNRHPDTDIVFKGFQIPEWACARKMIEEMARVLPKQRFVGWDIAYSESGWVMIEGNSSAQLVGIQVIRNKGIRDIIDRTFYRYLKESKKKH